MFFKNVQSTDIKMQLEMKNALLVQVIPKLVPEDKFSVPVKTASIVFKGKIKHIHVTVGACSVGDFCLQSGYFVLRMEVGMER